MRHDGQAEHLEVVDRVSRGDAGVLDAVIMNPGNAEGLDGEAQLDERHAMHGDASRPAMRLAHEPDKCRRDRQRVVIEEDLDLAEHELRRTLELEAERAHDPHALWKLAQARDRVAVVRRGRVRDRRDSGRRELGADLVDRRHVGSDADEIVAAPDAAGVSPRGVAFETSVGKPVDFDLRERSGIQDPEAAASMLNPRGDAGNDGVERIAIERPEDALVVADSSYRTARRGTL